MYRTGAGRAASLEPESRVSDGTSGRCAQHRTCPPDATQNSDLSPSSNRRMRSRMYGGVGAGLSNGAGYPIRRDDAVLAKRLVGDLVVAVPQ